MARRSIRAVMAMLCAAGMALVAAFAGAPAASASQAYGWALSTTTSSPSAISCYSSSFCVVVDGSSNHVHVYDGTSWTTTSISGATSFAAVSCPSATSCVAVGSIGQAPYTYAAGAWTAGPTAPRSMVSIGCLSASECYTASSNDDIYELSGGTWAPKLHMGGAPTGHAVSCTSTACYVVDSSGDVYLASSGSVSLDQHVVATFVTISCPSSSFCVAGDTSGRVWMGAPGSMTATSVASTISTVSCASTTFCVALDGGGHAYAYDGSTWSPLGSPSTEPLGVSCPSTTFCAEVDASGSVNVYGPLALSVSPETPYASPGTTYDAVVTANGGDTPYTYAVSGLPSWLSYDPTTHAIFGVVPGTATTATGISATVTDAANTTASAALLAPVATEMPDTVLPLIDARQTMGATSPFPNGSPALDSTIGLQDVAVGTNGWYVANDVAGVDFVPFTSGTYFGQAMKSGARYLIAGGSGAAGPIPGPALGADFGGNFTSIAVGPHGYLATTDAAVYFVPFTSGTYFSQAMTANDAYQLYTGIVTSVASDAQGDAYLAAKTAGTVDEIPNTSGTYFGHAMTAGNATMLENTGAPEAVAVDSDGNLYIADDSGAGLVMVPAASGTYFGQAMTAAQRYTIASGISPVGVAIDAQGNVYTFDTTTGIVFMVPATSCSSACPWGLSSMTAGTAVGIAGGGGSAPTTAVPGSAASIPQADSVAFDVAHGSLLIAEPGRVDAVVGGPSGIAPTLTSTAATSCTSGTACTFTVTASGTPVPALSETGTLPSGMTFADNGDGTATLSGTPRAAGSFPLTISATNAAGTAAQSFSLSVAAAPSPHLPAPGTLTVSPSTPPAPPLPTGIHAPIGFSSPVVTTLTESSPKVFSAPVAKGVTAALSTSGKLPLGTQVGIATSANPGHVALPPALRLQASVAVIWSGLSGPNPPPVDLPFVLSGPALHPGDDVYAKTPDAEIEKVATVGIANAVELSVIASGTEFFVAAPPLTRAPFARAKTSATAVALSLSCTRGAECTGPATLSVARRHGTTFAHLVVAQVRIQIAAGHRATARFALTPFGKKLVRAHHGKAFATTLLVRTAYGSRLVKRITLG